MEPKIGSDIEGTINNIKAKYRVEPYDCLHEMLSCWLKKVHPKPSWEGVITALENPFVGEERLAQTLKQKYCTIPRKCMMFQLSYNRYVVILTSP